MRLHITSSARHAEQAHYVRGSVCGNRVVTDLDANFSGKSLNVSVVRSITGQDFMNVSRISTKASASISCGSNNLPDVRQTSDWKQVAAFRRLAVIPMTADATSLCATRVPADKVDNVDFAILCVYVRSRFSASMPVTPRMVLMSDPGTTFIPSCLS